MGLPIMGLGHRGIRWVIPSQIGIKSTSDDLRHWYIFPPCSAFRWSPSRVLVHSLLLLVTSLLESMVSATNTLAEDHPLLRELQEQQGDHNAALNILQKALSAHQNGTEGHSGTSPTGRNASGQAASTASPVKRRSGKRAG